MKNYIAISNESQHWALHETLHWLDTWLKRSRAEYVFSALPAATLRHYLDHQHQEFFGCGFDVCEKPQPDGSEAEA